MLYTRREIGKMALAALAATRLEAKPNSKFGGVQIGVIISPYNYHEIPVAADELLPHLVQLGISAIELQDVRVEVYAGASPAVREGYSGSPRVGLSPEEREAAQRKAAEDLRKWRLSVSLDKYRVLRQLYNDAGVNIYAFRLAHMTQDMPDAEYDYFFNAAEALGANQITVELPLDTTLTQRVGDIAAKRKIWMGYHNHSQVNFHSWDVALSQSKFNGINFDVGHFAAAVSQSPVPFIQEHRDRITSLHLKDRKFRTNGGRNMPWGQGDTPLKEILQLAKKEGYTFPAAIELEYPIPEGSNGLAEIAKCLHFCEEVLA
jgi:sugar phosphate isomerase/epimerase